MRTRTIFFAVILVLVAILISMKTIFAQDLGPHGGRIEKAENYNIEMKTDYTHFYTYLLTKKNKSINNKSISCEIRFFLLDGTTIDLPLKPFGDDAFVIDYFADDYGSFRVTFQVAGKAVSAKFENEKLLVKKEK